MTREGIQIDEKLWSKFRAWAEDDGVSIESEDDWGPWWDCWIDGYNNAAGDYCPM